MVIYPIFHGNIYNIWVISHVGLCLCGVDFAFYLVSIYLKKK